MFLSAYDHAKRLHEELDDDQDMISPADFGLMFVDWSDPTKAVHMYVPSTAPFFFFCPLFLARQTLTDVLWCSADAELSESENAHIDLGIQVLSALYDEERTGEIEPSRLIKYETVVDFFFDFLF